MCLCQFSSVSLTIYVRVYVCVCHCPSVCLIFSGWVDVFMSVFIGLSYHFCMGLCACLSVRPSLLWFLCVSMSEFQCSSGCLIIFVCMPMCVYASVPPSDLSILCVSMCLCQCSSVCLILRCVAVCACQCSPFCLLIPMCVYECLGQCSSVWLIISVRVYVSHMSVFVRLSNIFWMCPCVISRWFSSGPVFTQFSSVVIKMLFTDRGSRPDMVLYYNFLWS